MGWGIISHQNIRDTRVCSTTRESLLSVSVSVLFGAVDLPASFISLVVELRTRIWLAVVIVMDDGKCSGRDGVGNEIRLNVV